ncbi:hypothetical protein [Mitsuaria sp. 7]|uniref:hypothetical protein n=1 Tax=Mitsuaria sp. 7 TaxID=1658665 RepID=UPI0007DD2A7A|nr:hypothetical protein [Mitsuaria sp. 7]ANH69177.1 hypothetical protein ABE85_19300 [Mitsuaria sp. 7]
MNSSTSPVGTLVNGPAKPENEDDDPVGDNKPVEGAPGEKIPEEEIPEGSDVRPRDPLNGHHSDEDARSQPARQPSSDSKLPQSSRG